MIKAIFAVGTRGEFGYKGGLPWGHCKVDMKHFADYTKSQVLVMGRNTYESLPKSGLPGRTLVVLTKNVDNIVDRELPCNCTMFATTQEKGITELLTNLDRLYEEDIIVIGGPSIILSAISSIDEISMTIVYNDESGPFDHDVRMDMGLLNRGMYSYFKRVDRYYPKTLELPSVTFELWERENECG